jgi:hypothetical protein
MDLTTQETVLLGRHASDKQHAITQSGEASVEGENRRTACVLAEREEDLRGDFKG